MGRGKCYVEYIREVTDQRDESLEDLHRAEASATPCAHCLLEEERRLRSLRYAAAIRRDEDLTRQARELIESIVSRGEATVVHRLWFSLLDEPVMFVIRCMTAADSDGQLLRSNNPFSLLVGEIDPGIDGVLDKQRGDGFKEPNIGKVEPVGLSAGSRSKAAVAKKVTLVTESLY